jgi:hypothetical protein
MPFDLSCDHYSVVEVAMHSFKAFPDFYGVIAGGFCADFIFFKVTTAERATVH